MGNGSNGIKEYLGQFFLIVFSVVFGLYLSERIEDRKDKQDSEDLLMTIKSELKGNMKLVNEWAPYHQKVNRGLDSLSKNGKLIAEFVNDESIFYKLFTKQSIMGRTPASDAWDIAKSHPLVTKIETDKLMILSKVYKQQAMTFEPMMDKMIKLLNTKDFNSEKEAQSNLELFSDYMNELVALEYQLMHYHKEAKEILDIKVDEVGAN